MSDTCTSKCDMDVDRVDEVEEKSNDCPTADGNDLETNGNMVEHLPETSNYPMSDDESTEDSDFLVAITNKKVSQDPNFAVICSFLQVFGDFLGLPRFCLEDLEAALNSTSQLAREKSQEGLVEILHLKLMRKLAKSCKTQYSCLARVSLETLPKFLLKVCNLLDLSFAWDLTNYGYHVLSIADKLLLLKHLCDLQFDENPKMRSFINEQYLKAEKVDVMRLKPIGADIEGRLAWLQEDIQHNNIRLYMVEDGDADGTSWKLVASNITELESVIERLKQKSNVNPKDRALQQRNERKEKAQKREPKVEEKEEQEEVKTPKKRGRKKKVSPKAIPEQSDDEDDNPCARCFSNRNPEEVLLCDGCDAAYHTLCLRPPMLIIPETDWYCPYCQQVALCEQLVIKLKDTMTRAKVKERAVKRMDFYGIKLSNIVDDGSVDGLCDANGQRRSGRSRKQIDYNFSDFDRIINEATGSKRDSTGLDPDSLTERRKHRRLNDVDAGSELSSGNEYQDEDDEPDSRVRTRRLPLQRTSGRRRSLRRRLRGDIDSEDDDEVPSSPAPRRTKRQCIMRNSALLSRLGNEEDEKPQRSDRDDDYDSKEDGTQSPPAEESDIASGSFSDDSLAQDLRVDDTSPDGHGRKTRLRLASDSESNTSSVANEKGIAGSSEEDQSLVDTDDLCQSSKDEDEDEQQSSEEEEIVDDSSEVNEKSDALDTNDVNEEGDAIDTNNVNEKSDATDNNDANSSTDAMAEPPSAAAGENSTEANDSSTTCSDVIPTDAKTLPSSTDSLTEPKASVIVHQKKPDSSSVDTILRQPGPVPLLEPLPSRSPVTIAKPVLYDNQNARVTPPSAAPVHLFQPYNTDMASDVLNGKSMSSSLEPRQVPVMRKKPVLSFGVEQLTSTPPNVSPRHYPTSPTYQPMHQYPYPVANDYTQGGYMQPGGAPVGQQVGMGYGYGVHVPQMPPAMTHHPAPYMTTHIPKQYAGQQRPSDMSIGQEDFMGYSPAAVGSGEHVLRTQEFQAWSNAQQMHYMQQGSPVSSPYRNTDPLRNFPYPPAHGQPPC